MTITVWSVTDHLGWQDKDDDPHGKPEDPVITGPHFEERWAIVDAQNSLAQWPNFSMPAIVEHEIDKLPNQKIEIDGNQVSYQFSQTKMGRRTVTRTVHDLRLVAGEVTGTVEWKGRILTVQRWVAGIWKVTEVNWKR